MPVNITSVKLKPPPSWGVRLTRRFSMTVGFCVFFGIGVAVTAAMWLALSAL